MTGARQEQYELTSRDGTRVAVWRSGRGPPLVMVHGIAVDHNYWRPSVEILEEHFTIHNVDRRGRGASGDSEQYAIEREFEDVAAVVDSVGEPANLFGHSFGGICSLEATKLTGNVRRMMLYEPPLTTPTPSSPLTMRLQALVEKGEKEKALEAYIDEGVHLNSARLARQRASPRWKGRVASVHTIVREQRSHETYDFVPDRFRGLKIPTLLLVGSESSPRTRAIIELLHDTLPDSRMVELPGQGHRAGSAPGEGTRLLTNAILGFLRDE